MLHRKKKQSILFARKKGREYYLPEIWRLCDERLVILLYIQESFNIFKVHWIYTSFIPYIQAFIQYSQGSFHIFKPHVIYTKEKGKQNSFSLFYHFSEVCEVKEGMLSFSL